MYKLYQVHMLPTEIKGYLDHWQLMKSNAGQLFNWHVGENTTYATPQHLYITSDEEIKDNDWYYWQNGDIAGVNQKRGRFMSKAMIKRKIVATTDKELRIKTDKPNLASYISFSLGSQIAQIPLSFVEEYVKRGGIKEVELEMVDNGHEVDMEGRGGEDIGWMPKIELKLTPSGGVICRLPVEKSETLARIMLKYMDGKQIDDFLDDLAANNFRFITRLNKKSVFDLEKDGVYTGKEMKEAIEKFHKFLWDHIKSVEFDIPSTELGPDEWFDKNYPQ